MDMLVVGMKGKGHVGLKGCTTEEYKTHFAFWAMMGSPLIIGCDLREADDEAMAILKNKELIRIDQDAAYRQPYFVNGNRNTNNERKGDEPIYSWYPDHMPVIVRHLENGDIAIGFFNLTDNEHYDSFTLDAVGLGFCTGKTLELTDVWTGETSKPVNDTVAVNLPAHGCAVYRAKVVDRK